MRQRLHTFPHTSPSPAGTWSRHPESSPAGEAAGRRRASERGQVGRCAPLPTRHLASHPCSQPMPLPSAPARCAHLVASLAPAIGVALAAADAADLLARAAAPRGRVPPPAGGRARQAAVCRAGGQGTRGQAASGLGMEAGSCISCTLAGCPACRAGWPAPRLFATPSHALASQALPAAQAKSATQEAQPLRVTGPATCDTCTSLRYVPAWGGGGGVGLDWRSHVGAVGK